MNILYEGAIFQILRCGGVARCFTELIRHLPDDCRPRVVAPLEAPLPLSHPHLACLPVQTEPPVRLLRKWTRRSLQQQIARTFDGQTADVEHWTYYGGLCRRPIRRGTRPLVVTVLDFVHEAFPDLDPGGSHVAMKYAAIRLADQLVCISQATHDELCDRFPEARRKASVIPLGTSLADVSPAPLPSDLRGRPYVLFVGRRNSYKNFRVVWQAWQRLRGRLPNDARLVVAGPPMKRREAAELQCRDEDSITLLANVDDALLKTLYQHCRSFLFPSLAEGFGLPSLEAMSAGAPVMVSDLPVMREVVGRCGYYFDPHDIGMVAELIDAAIRDNLPGRDRIVVEGRARAATFSWRRTAEQTAAVYRRLTTQRDASAAGEPTLCAA
jgi:glycosyltransferase involved in cell wall biosynthesis